MPSKKQSPLSKVQSLYLMQVELWDFLDGKEQDLSKAKKTLQEFTQLLGEVDPSVMGGEDIIESMQTIPTEVRQKLKKTGTAKKKVVKKVSAKKSKK